MPFGRGQRFGKSINPVLDALIGGWQASSTVSLNSGQPLNIRYGDTQAFLSDGQADFLGNVALRPNYVGGDLVLPSSDPRRQNLQQYLNPDAVAIATAAAPFGNLGRNRVYGFPLYQTDLSIQKNFKIPMNEVSRLNFRAEFFNLFNKTNFNAPVIDRRNGAYGRVTSTFDPRLIQLALKFTF
jgi:hypothetical protein